MRFWTREIAGWFLVLIGLFVFYTCYALVTMPKARIIEAGTLIFVGIFTFRGGIHLLKVAMAARVCLHAQAIHKEPEPRLRSREITGPRDQRANRIAGT